MKMRGLFAACLPARSVSHAEAEGATTATAKQATGSDEDAAAAAAAAALSRGDVFCAAAAATAAAQRSHNSKATAAPGTPGAPAAAPTGQVVVNLTATTPSPTPRVVAVPSAGAPAAALSEPSTVKAAAAASASAAASAPACMSETAIKRTSRQQHALAPTAAAGGHAKPAGTPDWLGPVQLVLPAATAAAVAATASGPIQMCPLDHGMMLTCLNPKVLWLPHDLDFDTLAAALGAALADFPVLAGRLLPAGPTGRARRLAARRACAFHIHMPTCAHDHTALAATTGIAASTTATSTTSTSSTTTQVTARPSAKSPAGKAAAAKAPAAPAPAPAAAYGGVALRQASSSCAALGSFLPLAALARSGFSQLGACRQLPPYCEPLDVDEALRGREPLLKVRLTHLRPPPSVAVGAAAVSSSGGAGSGHGGGGGGGCILAFTMHHAVLDGRSAHLFLDRLAAHYRRLLQPPATAHAPAAAAAAAAATGATAGRVHGGGRLAPSAAASPMQPVGLSPRLQPQLPQAPSPPLQPALTEVVDMRKNSSSSIDTTCSSSATCGSSYPASGKMPTLTTISSALAAAAAASAGALSDGRSSGGGGSGGTAFGALRKSSPAASDGNHPELAAAQSAAQLPPPPAPPVFDRSRLFPSGWAPAAGGKQRAAAGATSSAASLAPHATLLRSLELQHIPGTDCTTTAPSGAASTSAASSTSTSTCTTPATRSASLAGWGAALSAAGRLVRSVVAEERRGLRGASGRQLACEVLHIPRHQVAALKALASGSCTPAAFSAPTPAPASSSSTSPPAPSPAATCTAVSTNDAVTALVWLVMSELRGRPLLGATHHSHQHHRQQQQQQHQQEQHRHHQQQQQNHHQQQHLQQHPQVQPGAAASGGRKGGVASSSAAAAVGGYIGVAVDLRRNGQAPPSLTRAGCAGSPPAPSAAHAVTSSSSRPSCSPGVSGPNEPLLPPNFFGNGVWCLHVPAAGLPHMPGGPGGAAASAACCSCATSSCGRSGGATEGASASTAGSGCNCGGGGGYVGALRAGAAAVRASLNEMRGRADGGEQLLRAAAAQLTAPLSAQLEMMARVCLQQDAMVTCWSAIDYWSLDFGPGAGAAVVNDGMTSTEDDGGSPSGPRHNQPVQVQALLAPSPPWSAAIMAARPEGRAAVAGMPTGLGEGGLVVLLVVPEGATSALRGSRVVRTLVPAARFQ